ncbi:DUF2798 domain-containing protein [Rhizobium sp. S95]|uniref:DUF2798 domain-containing protein n=1 Tax=Ciceribacter sichuanensis TaxID=2949647 RepID=A0AAJ1BVC7_9HYPH|nr:MULTISPECIES: DUF2798 domain-containing protein [unclassified Ciceribacter]MCM2398958.1 DUF2798 domain-containing protein [Ciceribacter sp. S95]MCO5956836.1 DUF2798 domain-containing protein [Ciceribacter sp. S101]
MKLARLPARYAGILMPLVLSILMTFVVSGVSTVKMIGFHPEIISFWMPAWGISWLIAFPTLLGAIPVARRIVQAVTRPA